MSFAALFIYFNVYQRSIGGKVDNSVARMSKQIPIVQLAFLNKEVCILVVWWKVEILAFRFHLLLSFQIWIHQKFSQAVRFEKLYRLLAWMKKHPDLPSNCINIFWSPRLDGLQSLLSIQRNSKMLHSNPNNQRNTNESLKIEHFQNPCEKKL